MQIHLSRVPFFLVNQISGAHGQLVAPVVSTLSPSSGTSVVSEDDLSGEASHMNEVMISLMYSSLLISQEVLYLLYYKYQ